MGQYSSQTSQDKKVFEQKIAGKISDNLGSVKNYYFPKPKSLKTLLTPSQVSAIFCSKRQFFDPWLSAEEYWPCHEDEDYEGTVEDSEPRNLPTDPIGIHLNHEPKKP